MPLSPKYASVSNVNAYRWSPACANASASVVDEKGVLGVQEVTRPSVFVVAVKLRLEDEVVEDEEDEGYRVNVTGMLAAGGPLVVSWWWLFFGVLGGGLLEFVGVVVLLLVGGGVGAERCERREVRRGVGVGIRW